MSMSMNVVGYMPADENWNKMKAAWQACTEAGVSPPDAVSDFFGGEDPGGMPGKEVWIQGAGVKKLEDENREGYEVDITALPEGVRFVRFYRS